MAKRLPSDLDGFLAWFQATGDTCIPVADVMKSPRLAKLVQAKKLWTSRGYVTLPGVYKVEQEIARRVMELCYSKGHFPKVTKKEIADLIKEYETLEGERLGVNFKLAPEQEEAVFKAANAQFFVLTGGPGTGKTCVLKCIRHVLEKLLPNAEIAFTAPTGKAARRITESLNGTPACTVQKKMKLVSETARPKPIGGDCIVVDEVSMLDDLTADALFMSVRKGVRVILVGDVDQLPSVGFGSVLRDLLECGEIPCAKLRAPQRQDAKSVLFQNITNLRFGQDELFEGDDFHIIKANGTTDQKVVLEEYYKAVDKWGIDGVCLLTPYRRKGSTCANVMNDIIQKALNNPDKKPHITAEIVEDDNEMDRSTSRRITFALNDPVMQLVNREEIANGDVGKVTAVEDGVLTVAYDGNITVSYEYDELDQLNLAYAMSVHKSQGSEYKCVITCALPEHKAFLCRNLLYTAVTRAKKECVIIMDPEIVKSGLKRQAGYERNTLLRDMLEHEGRKTRLEKTIKFMKASTT